ncbi:MAG: carboxypeptidase-like regulatory domain-containing protein, partial [Saprospiraceae bacterium]|nr:carboxypeptidase-like regulatory domain-containing protein [Saprospiraceae bacterium]
MRYPILLALLFLCVHTLGGQSATDHSRLHGVVTADDGLTPVAHAHILVSATNKRAISAPDGSFSVSALPSGVHTLHVSCVGFRSVDTVVAVPQDSTFRIVLSEEVYVLPSLTVHDGTFTGGIQHLQSIPGSAYYLPSSQLAKMHHSDINRILGV